MTIDERRTVLNFLVDMIVMFGGELGTAHICAGLFAKGIDAELDGGASVAEIPT